MYGNEFFRKENVLLVDINLDVKETLVSHIFMSQTLCLKVVTQEILDR